MTDDNSVQIGTEAQRASYGSLSPMRRAEAAQEMANEVVVHYDHARTLVSALVTELRTQGTEESKAALQLATVTEAWLNDTDHLDQESRLFACLHATVLHAMSFDPASHLTATEASHV